jgi:hypothetical protein
MVREHSRPERSNRPQASNELGWKLAWANPNGSSVVVSAREPAHTQYRIDTDRHSEMLR